MTADWSRLSDAQLRAIDALDFAVPLHQTHLSQRYRVRGPTLVSLEYMGLITRVSLFEQDMTIPMPFFTLTREGLAFQRDWRRWRESASGKIAEITGTWRNLTAAALDHGIGIRK
jgi:hypothetical protein